MFMGYDIVQWYYITQIASAFGIIAGLVFTIFSVSIARKNLIHLIATNKENNELRKKEILQARLIELSNEWNSTEFVRARNLANLTLESIKDQEENIYKLLYHSKRIDEWIDISVVAHFFLRLARIDASDQIDRDKAKVEFQEAIEYWLVPILRAYRFVPKEELLQKTLIELHNKYSKDPYIPNL